MAFTAQTFRHVLGRKPSSPANLKDVIIENLSTMKAHFDNDTPTVTIEIFKAIVLDSEPIPSERRPRRRGDYLFSPPPTRDDITHCYFLPDHREDPGSHCAEISRYFVPSVPMGDKHKPQINLYVQWSDNKTKRNYKKSINNSRNGWLRGNKKRFGSQCSIIFKKM